MGSNVMDIYKNALPAWLRGALSGGCLKDTHIWVTYEQQLQMGLFNVTDGGMVSTKYVPGALIPSTSITAEQRACLVHSRTCHRTSLRQGDAPPCVDYLSTYLSCRGVALSSEKESISRLDRIQSERNHRMPFWLSEKEIVDMPASLLYILQGHGKMCDSVEISRRFASDYYTVPIINDRGKACRVMNIENICQKTLPCTLLPALLSFFRKFTPLILAAAIPFSSLLKTEYEKSVWQAIVGVQSGVR